MGRGGHKNPMRIDVLEDSVSYMSQKQAGERPGDKQCRGKSPALQILSGKATIEKWSSTNKEAELSSPGFYMRGIKSHHERSGEDCQPLFTICFPYSPYISLIHSTFLKKPSLPRI